MNIHDSRTIGRRSGKSTVPRGFTLIEIVAAVAVAALILSATYGVVTTTMTSQRRVEELLGVYKEGAAILNLVSEDLRSAVYRNKSQNFVVRTESEFPSFDFIGFGWNPETGRIAPGEIGYALERNDGRIYLYRRFARPDGSIEDGGTYTLVSNDILSWKVEYLVRVKREKEWEKEWEEEWVKSESLPTAVRVEFELEAARGEPVRFQREMALPTSNLLSPIPLPPVLAEEIS